jgi:hypothetical protein
VTNAMLIRTHPRTPTKCPVIFQTDRYLDEGYITDLSSQGCAIETERILMPDEYIQLHLLLRPQGLRVTVGKVRWSRGERFGVEFLYLPLSL